MHIANSPTAKPSASGSQVMVMVFMFAEGDTKAKPVAPLGVVIGTNPVSSPVFVVTLQLDTRYLSPSVYSIKP